MRQSDSQDRICVVQLISDLAYGGAQRQVVELANNLDADRFDVHVCSLSDYVPLAEELKKPSQRLHILHKRWKFDVTVIPRLATLLRRLRADIVHSYLFDANIAARLAGRLARTPLVVGSERNTDYTLKPHQLMAYRLTRRYVDVVVANSHRGAAFNSRTLDIDPSRYDVVHNGVDTTRFFPRKNQTAKAAFGIHENELVVGMFASFKRQKNHPLFFAAAACVLQRFPQARFLLVGDELHAGQHGSNAYKRQVQHIVETLGIADRCIFLGNRTDVARLYSLCHVTVLPSLYEGTPNVLLESMACGVPVVATTVSDNAYIVPDGQVGYLVAPGDQQAFAERLSCLLGDAALRTQMGHAARAWMLQEFSMPRAAQKMAHVYSQALKKRKQGWENNSQQKILSSATV